MTYEMNPKDENYITDMIDAIVAYRGPARLSPDGMAVVWASRQMALSNLAVAHELAGIRKVLEAGNE